MLLMRATYTTRILRVLLFLHIFEMHTQVPNATKRTDLEYVSVIEFLKEHNHRMQIKLEKPNTSHVQR